MRRTTAPPGPRAGIAGRSAERALALHQQGRLVEAKAVLEGLAAVPVAEPGVLSCSPPSRSDSATRPPRR